MIMLKKILTWIENTNPAPTSFIKQDAKYAVNALALKFISPDIRQRFQAFIQPYDLHAIRSAAFTGGAIYGLFVIFDYIVNYSIFTETAIIRLLIVGPCAILTLGLTFLEPFKTKHYVLQLLSVLIVSIGQAGHFVIAMMPDVHPFYLLATSILLTVFCNTLMCIRFRIAFWINIIYFFVFLIVLIGYNQESYDVKFYQSIIFIAVIIVSLHACYIRDRDKHLLFIHYDGANEKKKALAGVNSHLEDLLNSLDAKNKELEQFAYVVSHDLKSPLRVISGLSSLIQRKEYKKISPQSRQDFDMIIDQIVQMNAMIEGVLEYSRIGRTQVESVMVNVEQVLEQIKLAIPKNDKVVIDYPTNVPPVEASKVRVRQIFQNLINNAIKYNDKTVCKIFIETEIADNFVSFKLEDNGPGIRPEYAERAFGLFQTLQTKEQDSTGVGLAIVKKIIEYYGGQIHIDTAYRQGLRFHFTLPYYQENEQYEKIFDNETVLLNRN